MRLTLTSALAALLTSACTDADLELSVDPDNPMLRMQASTDVCAPPPLQDAVPYKILFVIDTSLSNMWNDKNHKRHDAYERAVTEFAGVPNVYFGIVTFNSTAHRPTVMFTQDEGVLLTAADALWSKTGVVNGQTNYEDALAEMLSFIVGDLGNLSQSEARRTRYHVYWLSDGFPTEGTTDQATLVQNVRAVRTYVESVAGDFALNAAYLESTGVYETGAEITAARSLLVAMAEAGGGTFTDITAGGTFDFDIDPAPVVKPFTLAAFFANNVHTRFGAEHPLPDSDADGLTDDDEALAGSDPHLRDTDGDGYGDGVEALTAWLQAGLVNPGCEAGALDTDADGLADCEEDVLGTSPSRFDSDGDLLPDRIEVAFGSSPLLNDPMADVDLDGMQDWDEVALHLDPLRVTAKEDLGRWGYRYRSQASAPTADGRPCHALSVDNIGVFQTLATPEHPLGGQEIELLVSYRTFDGEHVVFKRGVAPVGYLQPDVQIPASGLVLLDDEELTLLPSVQ